MTHRRWLVLILAAYVFLAVTYSVVTPIFEASDELWHYPMVKYLADHSLSLPSPDATQPWRQEGGQPPLYYMLAAVLTGGIDTSDMDFVRRINPHADIGVVRADRNANMIVHRAEAESFPWRGTTLAVHVIRLFSIALGACTVLVTYALAREVFPSWHTVALGAAALNGFLPMFLFISGSVNNDNLSNLLGNLLTLLIVRLLQARAHPPWRDYALIGVVTGAGLLAKLNIGFLIPLVAFALVVVSIRLRDGRPLVLGGLIAGVITIAIAGWWYARNAQLYGDPTGLNAFLDTVGRRLVPANLAQLWAERHSFTQAYWGFFGGMNVPLPTPVYQVFNLIGGLSLVSAAVFGVVRVIDASRERRHETPPPAKAATRNRFSPFSGLKTFFNSGGGFDANGQWRSHVPHEPSPRRRSPDSSVIPLPYTNHVAWLPALVTVLWTVVTFGSYLRWTAETPASQGRLLFGALSSISLWMAVGLVWWLPRRAQPLMVGSAATFFAVVAALAPFFVIAPAYAPPQPATSDGDPQAQFEAANGAISLLASEVVSAEAQPGTDVLLVTDWRITQRLDRDWSLFVHLVTPDGVIISQRDVYPGGGTLATSDLAAGYAWHNPLAIHVPPAAYTPMTLDVTIGWYHLPTGERLTLADGEETVTIGQVALLPRTGGDTPNPMRVNFDNQLELVGYALSDLSPQADDHVTLTLYWRALRPIEANYTVFAHIIDPRSLAIIAGSDAQPASGNAPTSTWAVGALIEDTHTLTLAADANPAIYELEIGLYLQAPDGSFPRLRIVSEDGGMADNFLYLSRVRVEPGRAE